jgi:FkbM family methyltransferase
MTLRARIMNRLARNAGLLRWTLAGALTRRRHVHARGVTFTLPCDNPITHFRWRSYDSKEPDTLDWIDTAFAGVEVLFDVGANVGLYSLYAALRHRGLRVVAFEPEYANLHLLRDNIVENRLGDRIEPYAVALGDRSGLSRLHLQDFTPGSALHSEDAGARTRTDTGHRVVGSEGICVMRLDDFCTERQLSPHALKIDVDGGERRVLEGARRTLGTPALRTVLIELPDDHAERDRCAALLQDAGLHVAGRADGSANEIWRRDAVPAGVARR